MHSDDWLRMEPTETSPRSIMIPWPLRASHVKHPPSPPLCPRQFKLKWPLNRLTRFGYAEAVVETETIRRLVPNHAGRMPHLGDVSHRQASIPSLIDGMSGTRTKPYIRN